MEPIARGRQSASCLEVAAGPPSIVRELAVCTYSPGNTSSLRRALAAARDALDPVLRGYEAVPRARSVAIADRLLSPTAMPSSAPTRPRSADLRTCSHHRHVTCCATVELRLRYACASRRSWSMSSKTLNRLQFDLLDLFGNRALRSRSDASSRSDGHPARDVNIFKRRARAELELGHAKAAGRQLPHIKAGDPRRALIAAFAAGHGDHVPFDEEASARRQDLRRSSCSG